MSSYPNVTFSKRRCKLCGKDVLARDFGEHVFTHSDDEVARWPGGQLGLLDDLRESALRSAEEAKGAPDARAQLLMAAEVIGRVKEMLTQGQHKP